MSNYMYLALGIVILCLGTCVIAWACQHPAGGSTPCDTYYISVSSPKTTITLPVNPRQGYLLIVIPRGNVPTISGNGATIYSRGSDGRWYDTQTVTAGDSVARIDFLWDGAHWYATGM